MSKRNRVFLGLLLVFGLGMAGLLYKLVSDLDPRYRESTEESLVDATQLLAAAVEQDVVDGRINTRRLEPLFRAAYARAFAADIYGVPKTKVDLLAYVTDAQGAVIFDSMGQSLGQNFGNWRDVALTLRGEYGARTTPTDPKDPNSVVMWVAAPIYHQGLIVGSLSLGKPTRSFGQFVQNAQRKTLSVGLVSVVGVLLLAVTVAVWLVRPLGLVAESLRYMREERLTFTGTARHAWRMLGLAYDDMRDALAGRSHVADYVQTLTHEVKSPLSAIRGAAELLQEPMPESVRQRFLANITRESARIQELVDRMMALTALESRRTLGELQDIDLAALVHAVATETGDSATGQAHRGVVVIFDGRGAGLAAQTDPSKAAIGGHAPIWVRGDPFLLRQALSNLLDNAVDFSPTQGRVLVRIHDAGRKVHVRITDEGPGIPDYAQDKVFEKFYSLARPHSAKRSTGLGLAFVREIALLHHGQVQLQNRPTTEGSGAVAVLTLRSAARRLEPR